MSEFKQYKRNGITEMRPYVPGESLERVSISQSDREQGCPKEGDWIARNPGDEGDRWLVNGEFFKKAEFVEFNG
jgi:hypothetical protein